jgi:hypothetical protein
VHIQVQACTDPRHGKRQHVTVLAVGAASRTRAKRSGRERGRATTSLKIRFCRCNAATSARRTPTAPETHIDKERDRHIHAHTCKPAGDHVLPWPSGGRTGRDEEGKQPALIRRQGGWVNAPRARPAAAAAALATASPRRRRCIRCRLLLRLGHQRRRCHQEKCAYMLVVKKSTHVCVCVCACVCVCVCVCVCE